MVPDQNGTGVSFMSGNTQTYTLNYTLDANWPVENVEFVAMVQDPTGKEVQQCVKRGAIDLNVDFEASNTVINKGDQVTFNNLTSGGYINALELYHWEFPGATPDTSNEKNPVVTYDECGPHDVTLVVWRGGQADTVVKSTYIQVGPVVNVTAIPDDTTCWYQPITLDATTPDATYLWEPGGATTPSIEVGYPEYGYGSHTFTVTVTTPDGCIQTVESVIFIDACTGLATKNNDFGAEIFPNPNNGTFTLTTGSEITGANLSIVDMTGKTVYSRSNLTNKHRTTISVPDLQPGLYSLILQSGDKKSSQKFMVH